MTQLSWMDLGDRERTRAGAVKFKQYTAADQKRDAGIELVYSHSDTYWRREAQAQLQHLIQTHAVITSDDILIPLEERGVVTGDTRAIAAIIKGAQRAGQIEPLPYFVPTRRPSRHKAPIRQWKVVRARV